MGQTDIEKRTCVRFMIPGAAVNYKKAKSFFRKNKYLVEPFPLLDISRGGIRFFAQKFLKFESLITLKISVPEETAPLTLLGIVRWQRPGLDPAYKCEIGVQFLPYGKKKSQNDPHVLIKIIDLEKKYADKI